MRIGVVGYGTGGRHFHAPFIAAARGCELAGIVTRAPDTVAHPGSTLADGVAALAVAEAATESLHTGRTVELGGAIA